MRIADVQPGQPTSVARVMILTADKFEDLELLVPYFRFVEAGIHADIVAPTLKEISGEHGYSVVPDRSIDDVDPDDYDLLFIPGGYPDGAPATIRDTPRAQEIARSFFERDKPVAAICHGPWLLASSDVVRGRRVTSYWEDGVPEDLQSAGGLWSNQALVVDGNLVTSRWPPDLAAFCDAVMSQLERLSRSN